jgi:hypothetical protein
MESCPICLETLHDNISRTECGHEFHTGCLYDWYNKVKRLDCPYCRHMSYFDKELILKIESLFVKLASCKNVRDFSLKNLKKLIETKSIYNEWYYKKAIIYIISYDEKEVEIVVDHCLKSLVSRGYLEQKFDLYYYLN